MTGGFTDRGMFRSFDDAEREGPHPNAPDPARNAPVPLVVEILREQPRSILVRLLEEGAGEVWLAKSLIRIEPSAALRREGVTIRIEVPRWLAEERGLCAAAGAGQGELFGGAA